MKGCIVAAALLAVGVGFLLLAAVQVSIPYQDPTPELQAQYARDMEDAQTLGLIGAATLGGGLLAGAIVVYRWVRRRRNERRTLPIQHDA